MIKCKDVPELAVFVKAVGSRKQSLTFTVCEKVNLFGRYWNGGSRSEYVAVDIATMKMSQAEHAYNPLVDSESVTIPLPEGIVIIRIGTFCGKPATPHIFINPANAAKLIKA